MSKRLRRPEDIGASARAVEQGMAIARHVFEKRGNHAEAHLSEEELASLLAFAYDLGESGGEVAP